MTAWGIVSAAFGLVGTISAVVFAYLAFRRNSKSDDTAEGKQAGVLLTEIGYIKSGVDDIKRKQEKQDDQHVEVVHRLTVVEESTKSAHHRIDNLESEIKNNN